MEVDFVDIYAVAQQMLDDLHRVMRQTAFASEAAELERKLGIVMRRLRSAGNLDEAQLRTACQVFLTLKKATARLMRQAAAMDTLSGTIH